MRHFQLVWRIAFGSYFTTFSLFSLFISINFPFAMRSCHWYSVLFLFLFQFIYSFMKVRWCAGAAVRAIRLIYASTTSECVHNKSLGTSKGGLIPDICVSPTERSYWFIVANCRNSNKTVKKKWNELCASFGHRVKSSGHLNSGLLSSTDSPVVRQGRYAIIFKYSMKNTISSNCGR